MDPSLASQSDISSPSTRGGVNGDAGNGAQSLERTLSAAREEIAALEARLATEARSRVELIHLVSHELRTPITVISGFARLLQGESAGKLGPEQRRYVEECLAACRRLDRLVGDLLAASSDSSQSISIEPRAMDLDAGLRSLLESLEPLLAERGQRVETRWGGARRVELDPGRIEQVMTNLLRNAVRHGRAGGRIRVATELVALEEANECHTERGFGAEGRRGGESSVRISVEDDGPGILEADRERILQAYVRGPTNGDHGGLGIGLAICRRIILAHGGTISVGSSRQLGGARFSVVLPCEALHAREAVDR